MGLTNSYEGLDAHDVGLVRHHAGILVRRGGLQRADRDDVEQELALDLLQRLPRFDAARASRRTFASRVVAHRAAEMLAGCWSAKASMRRAALPLDGDDVHAPVGIGHDDQRHDLRIDVAAALATLSAEHQAVCAALTRGSEREAARRIGVPRRTLRDRVAEIRAHFFSRGLADYASSPPPIHTIAPVCNAGGQSTAPLGRTA
jgi:RNA polymerase sigma-70 factor, ECF subfamily